MLHVDTQLPLVDLRLAHAVLERRFKEQSRELTRRTEALEREMRVRKRAQASLLATKAAVRSLREEHEADVGTRGLLDTARLAAERLASAVESIQDAFALFDRDDRLVLCNSVYRGLIGEAHRGPVVGISYESLLDAWMRGMSFADEVDRACFRVERLQRRHNGPMTTFDLRMRDGRTLRVVDRRTVEGGIVNTISDVTEDVRLSDELREARRAADAANGAKSEFLSSMSHELRTPLNAILGFAQLLQRDRKERLSDRHQDRVGQILRGGQHLLRLIDDILDLSRIEAGGVSMSLEPVNVYEVLEEVMSTLEPMAARQGLLMDREACLLPPPPVKVDRTRFAQILMNFGSNAIKYNRPGGSVAFTILEPRPGYVRVAVRDTGMGIPSDKQSKLFQPFQRAGQEMGPIEGTGIGLVITKQLARLMNGDVGFQSILGEGSEFWVDIPVHEPRSQASVPAARQVGSKPLVDGGRGLILYVEDDPASVRFIRDLLDSLGNVDLVTAPTAEAGVELARQQTPAVVIMDINLPGLSGLDALRTLRGTPETRDIPIIALTAASSESDKRRGMRAGFHGYLTKPVNVEELVTALEGVLIAS